MFDFRVIHEGETVFENTDPRIAYDSVEIHGARGLLSTIDLRGVEFIELVFRPVSFANKPIDYVATLDSPEYKKAVEDYEASLEENVQGTFEL